MQDGAMNSCDAAAISKAVLEDICVMIARLVVVRKRFGKDSIERPFADFLEGTHNLGAISWV